MLITEFQKGYLVGLFDGEGCITLNKAKWAHHWKSEPGKVTIYTKYKLHIRVASTNYEILEWLLELCGGAIYWHGLKGEKRGNRQDSWVWHIEGIPAKSFLEIIQPHTIIKKEQVNLALEFLQVVRSASNDEKEEFYLKFRKLNARGIQKGETEWNSKGSDEAPLLGD